MEKSVVELFAGVGGFRVGMNEVQLVDNVTIEKDNFKFVWANQWEPSTIVQHAFECYKTRFSHEGEISNIDITLVDKKLIPDHSVLCGGFPCQDYSVARTLSGEKGIQGKKGVLWWQINEILKEKKPPFVILENVDRLIKSPSKQRGRDFGIMLRCLSDLGYAVEWRVINAADYGHPQKRRRVYIFAYNHKTNYFKTMKTKKPENILTKEGLFAKRFPVSHPTKISTFDVKNQFSDLVKLSDNFKGDFENSGYMIEGLITTTKLIPILHNPFALKNIVINNGVDDKYILSTNQMAKFAYLRGKKKIERTDPNGNKYFYSEGSMSEHDSLSAPGRTMLTSEGSINRSTHVIVDPKTGKLRILTPIECERLNEFPDDWTNTGMPERRRYFMMGNALVTGVIRKVSQEISQIIDNE